jgi:phage anti-repressor protein
VLTTKNIKNKKHNMTELIKLHTRDEQQVISAKELYEFLGLHKANWKRWYETNIINNSFAFENWDWWKTIISPNHNESVDYWVTLDFAKRLTMQTRSESGEIVRRYFLDCERKLQEVKNAVQEFEYLTLEQVFYVIDLINCFKFIAHQKAAEALHKDNHISDVLNEKNITITRAAQDFHIWRNAALDLDPDVLNDRLLRYYNEEHPYARDLKTKRKILYLIDKYGLIKVAVFDFIKGASQKPDATALKVGEIAQKLAERMNVEFRDENKPDLFNEQEILNPKLMKHIAPHLPENRKRLNKSR